MRSDIDPLGTRGSASLPCVQKGEGRSALRPWTRRSASLPCVLIFGLAVFGQVLAADFIQESARRIPLVKETDVLVVGGSSGAVSAALAAKATGADVYLVAPRPYLGEDIAGTLRLGLEDGEEPDTELAQELWLDRSTTVPFTYKADAPAMYKELG